MDSQKIQTEEDRFSVFLRAVNTVFDLEKDLDSSATMNVNDWRDNSERNYSDFVLKFVAGYDETVSASYDVHRTVLGVCAVLRGVMCGNPGGEFVIPSLPKLAYDSVSALLDFLYGINKEPNADNVSALLYFAERLGYPALKQACLELIRKLIEENSVSVVAQFYDEATHLGIDTLQDLVIKECLTDFYLDLKPRSKDTIRSVLDVPNPKLIENVIVGIAGMDSKIHANLSAWLAYFAEKHLGNNDCIRALNFRAMVDGLDCVNAKAVPKLMELAATILGSDNVGPSFQAKCVMAMAKKWGTIKYGEPEYMKMFCTQSHAFTLAMFFCVQYLETNGGDITGFDASIFESIEGWSTYKKRGHEEMAGAPADPTAATAPETPKTGNPSTATFNPVT